MEVNKIYKADCQEWIKSVPAESVDCILTDPPYLYLKGQKLERPFNEQFLFAEFKRVLKPTGFVVLFGRGTSFYRWNTLLADLGFKFKEEIIWSKGQSTSPLMPLSRVHETVSIHTKCCGIINKVKVPYLEIKKHNLDSIITDIKRLRTVLRNTKHLDAVLKFIENNARDMSDSWQANNISVSSGITKEDRTVSVMRAVKNGMNEKNIIREDREIRSNFTKFGVTTDVRASGNRVCTVLQSVTTGMNEKSIIYENRDHYTAVHPTQKPVKLLERLLALTTSPGAVVLDPFAGSFSTAIAALNLDLKYLCCEIDSEYYAAGRERVSEAQKQKIAI